MDIAYAPTPMQLAGKGGGKNAKPAFSGSGNRIIDGTQATGGPPPGLGGTPNRVPPGIDVGPGPGKGLGKP